MLGDCANSRMGIEKVSCSLWPQLCEIPGGEYKSLREAAVGLAVAWCSNPVSGMTSAGSVLLSKQARNDEKILSFPRSL